MRTEKRAHKPAWVLPGTFFMAALILSVVVWAGEDAKPRVSNEPAWRAVFLLIDAKLPDDKSLAEILGPLPADTTALKLGSQTPEQFAVLYQASIERVQLVMWLSARARLRELSRRDVLDQSVVDSLLGPQPAGVRGSEFFGIPSVPSSSYHALLSYLEFAAANIPGGGYEPTEQGREKINRALQASLAVSSPETRLQYRDFDVVWSSALKEYMCQGEGESLRPGLLWLYHQIHDASGLDWLPEISDDLKKMVEAEGGAFFLIARKESESMPDSLAGVTRWRCTNR